MALLEISEVVWPEPGESLLDSYLDSPAPGATVDRTTLEISGWLIGRPAEAREVEVRASGVFLRTIQVCVARPDVVAKYPEAPERCGFWSLVGLLGVERDFTLDLAGVLADGTRVDLGSIRGRRGALTLSAEPRLQPLLVTSLARTGTTLLMGLLSAHPEIVAHTSFPYEVFAARYWLHFLRVLSDAADHENSSNPATFAIDIRRIGHNPFHRSPVTNDPALADLLGRGYVERLAQFSQQSIDDFYEEVARLQKKPDARFFAEKFHPSYLPNLARELYSDTREIILVRDFRDLICSVFAFNGKRKTLEFGRDQVSSDEEYVRQIRRDAELLLAHWRSSEDAAELVRYEDLVKRPAETLERILTYVGVARDPELAESMIRSAFEHAEYDDHRTSASVEASVGRWRHELPSSLRPVAREELGDALAAFGYDPE